MLATELTRGTEFKRGGSSLGLGYRPVGAGQVTRVQIDGATMIISYRSAVGRGATIPWVRTRSGWKDEARSAAMKLAKDKAQQLGIEAPRRQRVS